MNIGIMISEQSPQIGGGFTFEEGILESLINLKGESPHKFTLISGAKKPSELPGDLPMISVRPALSKQAKVSREISRLWKKLSPTKRDEEAETYIFDFQRAPELASAPLHAIVYLNPFESPFLDIPYIINVWDLAHRLFPFFPEISLTGEWELRERLYREKLQRAAYVLVTNEVGKKEIVDYQVPPEKIKPLHLPTPSYALRAGEDSSVGNDPAPLGIRGDFLFYPAQFWPHKNHMVLLRALKILKEKYDYKPQLVLTGSDKPLFKYSGEGNLAFLRRRVRELSLEDQVIFPGFVTREEMIALYRQALALVFPSFFGPENLPPLEAFALGCPVITGAVSGSEEQYGDSAILADPTKPEQWAQAVQALRQDEGLRASLIKKGRVRSIQHSSDDYVRSIFGLLDDFEAYRCNWTSSINRVPLRSAKYAYSVRLPSWESRYHRPR